MEARDERQELAETFFDWQGAHINASEVRMSIYYGIGGVTVESVLWKYCLLDLFLKRTALRISQRTGGKRVCDAW